jgi:hypothetical protein
MGTTGFFEVSADVKSRSEETDNAADSQVVGSVSGKIKSVRTVWMGDQFGLGPNGLAEPASNEMHLMKGEGQCSVRIEGQFDGGRHRLIVRLITPGSMSLVSPDQMRSGPPTDMALTGL